MKAGGANSCTLKDCKEMQAVLAFCSAKELSVHIKSVLFIEDELWCTEQTDSVLTRWGTVGCSLKKKNNPVGYIPDIDVGLIVFVFFSSNFCSSSHLPGSVFD